MGTWPSSDRWKADNDAWHAPLERRMPTTNARGERMNLTQLIRRFTIRTRMLGAVAMVCLALLAVGGVGLASQYYARTVNNDFLAQDFAAMTHIAQLRTAMSTLRAHEKDMIIQYENAVEVSKAKEAWTTTLAQIQASAKSLRGVLHNDAERAKVDEAMASLMKFKENFIPVAKQLEAMGFDSARVAAAFMSRGQADYDNAQVNIESSRRNSTRRPAKAASAWTRPR
jgi:hypothetical protein